jgi:hypothetical protein
VSEQSLGDACFMPGWRERMAAQQRRSDEVSEDCARYIAGVRANEPWIRDVSHGASFDDDRWCVRWPQGAHARLADAIAAWESEK